MTVAAFIVGIVLGLLLGGIVVFFATLLVLEDRITKAYKAVEHATMAVKRAKGSVG